MPIDDVFGKLLAALPTDYTLDRYLDAGGQGTVFLGTYCGTRAAIKLFASSSDQRRIDREIALLSNVNCANLVRILGSSRVEIDGAGCPLIAYEYVNGGDLRQFLDVSAPPILQSEIVRVGADVGSAIEALWQLRICHRDIKPPNIIRSADRYVLADVGLARHLDRSNLTAPGLVAGTAGYMSPEQARGRKDLTIRSDIFSLGVTLYELASRVHPFKRNQFLIGTVEPTPLAVRRPDLTQALTQLVGQMMAIRLTERPTAIASRFKQLVGS